jgi:3',5'-cyclic AMP phosphodiesterase CpdA
VTGCEVFAVEDTAVQVCWPHLDAGALEVCVGDRRVGLDWSGGPGAATVDGLDPARDYEVQVAGAALNGWRGSARTLPALDGDELARFATLSDLHIGSDEWDLFGRMREPSPGGDIHTVRCTRAALAELQQWGAQRLLLKGDLTDKGQPAEWDTLGALLDRVDVPVHAIPGNHDVKSFDDCVSAEAGAARIDLELIRSPRAIDLPGLRVIMFDSTVPELHKGRVSEENLDRLLVLLREHDGPCLIATHHYPQPTPVAWFWPPGIPGTQARTFLDAVARTNPRTFVTSGHSHRHRRRQHGPVQITEVGSPRDYPGTYGGYVVHEGGIRQVVRRIEAPEAISWTERTRRGAFGAWGRWSPGRLDERCFIHRW